MANYPGSVFSPATINTGDSIDASHPNQANDEINAVENALVNGEIAHDVTPSSSAERSLGEASKRWSSLYVDAIQSTGNSTLGNLTVNNLQVNGTSSGVVTVPDYVRLYNSADIEISSGLTVLTFDQQRAISNSSMHSTASNSSIVTTQSSGMYMVTASVVLASTVRDGFGLNLLHESTTVIARQYNGLYGVGGASTRNAVSVATAYPAGSGETFSVQVFLGNSTNTVRNSSDTSPVFSVTKL